ncbi:MAG TPA: hypothetical protein DIC56_02525, partial [Rhizobium sp.]|nr:hypothetical protein [Rhizobium sp.]
TALMGLLAELGALPLAAEGTPLAEEDPSAPAAGRARKSGAAAETDLPPAEKPAPAQMSMF